MSIQPCRIPAHHLGIQASHLLPHTGKTLCSGDGLNFLRLTKTKTKPQTFFIKTRSAFGPRYFTEAQNIFRQEINFFSKFPARPSLQLALSFFSSPMNSLITSLGKRQMEKSLWRKRCLWSNCLLNSLLETSSLLPTELHSLPALLGAQAQALCVSLALFSSQNKYLPIFSSHWVQWDLC